MIRTGVQKGCDWWKLLGWGIEEKKCRGPYVIVPEPRQTPRPALALSSQAADSSHPKLLTPIRVSVALTSYSKKIQVNILSNGAVFPHQLIEVKIVLPLGN